MSEDPLTNALWQPIRLTEEFLFQKTHKELKNKRIEFECILDLQILTILNIVCIVLEDLPKSLDVI